MRPFVSALVLLFVAALPGSASAQTGQNPTQPGPHDALWAENLLTPLPNGWKVATNRSNRQGFTIQEFIPASQTLADWSEMVTVLIYRGAGGAPLARFFEFQENVYRNGCESPPLVGKRQELIENGYTGGAQILACAKTKRWGKAEAMIYKTIKGKDAAYQVQRAWRLPASDNPNRIGITKEMLAAGTDYLRQVYVCDTRDPSHPCPKVKQ
jgi:hypothetical protein